MRYTILLFWVAIVLLPSIASAQYIFSSPYSVYGVGTINGKTSSLTRSIGGTGIAVQDEQNLNPVNPASYGSIASPISHVFETGFYLESNRYTTNSSTETKTVGGLSNLNYWFKFKPWWASTVGLTPFSSVSYKIKTTRALGSSDDVGYTYEGSGNINQLYWGNSVTLFNNLSIGIHASYLFGNLTKTESLDITEGSTFLTYENQVIARKLDVDIGLQYRIRFKKRSLIIGAVADDGLRLTGKQKSALYDESADTLTSATGDLVRYKLPASAGIGLSLQSPRSILAADLRYENWSNASYGDQEVIFQDSWKLSAGYIYKGNPRAENYLGLISLRGGFYVQNYPLKLKSTTFPLWGLSAGVSLPMFDGKSAVNLTYALDQFGTTRNTLILQRSQKLTVDIVIRDLWGIKRKFD